MHTAEDIRKAEDKLAIKKAKSDAAIEKKLNAVEEMKRNKEPFDDVVAAALEVEQDKRDAELEFEADAALIAEDKAILGAHEAAEYEAAEAKAVRQPATAQKIEQAVAEVKAEDTLDVEEAKTDARLKEDKREEAVKKATDKG